MTKTYDVKGAAVRARRDVRTIERWIANEDLEVYVIRDTRGRVIRRYVTEEQLLTVLRDKIRSNPTRRKIPNDVTPP